MKKRRYFSGKSLTDETEIKVRFSEVDSMGIVWHGSYVKYLEDAREAFGRKYGISYMDVYKKHGFMIPLVKLDIDYKKQLFYEDEIIVKTTLHDSPASKMIFTYEIYRKSDNDLILTAETVQIFMNRERELELNIPEFFKDWKEKKLK